MTVEDFVLVDDQWESLFVFNLFYFPYKAIIDGMIPVDTGRKLNVHKTLCTFNLRPVSTWICLIKTKK